MIRVIIVIMVALLAFPAAAQTVPHITVHTEYGAYGPGETVRVHGVVGTPHDGAVTIRVVSPTGNVVAVGQVVPDAREWSWDIPAEFGRSGTYTILADYTISREPTKVASAAFVYAIPVAVPASSGAIPVNGTALAISYVGDPPASARTDYTAMQIHLEFDGPSSGVMWLPDGLADGTVIVVDGGNVTLLPDGSYAYATDGPLLTLAADAVVVPEFGAALPALAAAGIGAAALSRARHRTQ